MTTIAIIALIAAIGSMSIANMNRNAFARSSHHDHEDNEGNNRHVCIVQLLADYEHNIFCSFSL
jgi:hypothetical protein